MRHAPLCADPVAHTLCGPLGDLPPDPFDQPMRKNLTTTTALVCASDAAPGGVFARRRLMH